MAQNKNWLPFLLLVTLSIIWGSSFLLMKIGLQVLTPIQLAAIRISIAGLVFMPFALKHIKRLNKEDRKYALLAGLIGNGIPAFLFALAQTKVNSSLAGVLNATTPLFTLLIGALFTSMVLTSSKIVGVIIGLVGAVIIVLGKVIGGLITGEQSLLEETNIAYTLLVVLATVCYGANINLIKSKLSQYKAIIISTIPLSFIALPGILILLFSDWSNVQSVEAAQVTRAIGATAILALVGTSLGLFLFNRLIQISGPVFSSSVTYFIPVVALILGVLDGERILGIQAIGMLLILTGVYLLNRAART